MNWEILHTKEYINLAETLFSGQIFTFTKNAAEEEYAGYLDNNLFIFKQDHNSVLYKTTHSNPNEYLNKFFNLDINYELLIKEWNHPMIKNKGLRLLRIDSVEVILSFICSQNNNIKRISQMVMYLKKISNNFYNLNFCIEDLRKRKFGYRAQYIIDAVNKLKKKILNYTIIKTKKMK